MRAGWRKGRLGAGVLAITLALALTSVALAAQRRPDDPRDRFHSANDYVVPAGKTVPHDLYVLADSVRVDGRVEGDLFVLARDTTIDGVVTGGLFVLGGELKVNGSVEGSVRALGGDVTVRGQVTKDLLTAAQDLTLTQRARIGGDLIYAALNSSLHGTVDGGTLGTSGVRPAGASQHTALDLNRSGPEGDVARQQEDGEETAGSSGGKRLARIVLRFLSIALAGALLLWVAYGPTWRAAGLAGARPLRALGAGALTVLFCLVALLAFGLAIFDLLLAGDSLGARLLILVMTFGALIGGSVVLFVLSVVVLFVANAVAGLTIGRLLLERVPGAERLPASARTSPFLAMAGGALIVTLLTALPLIGGLLSLLAILFGVGALVLSVGRGRAQTAPVTA
jgi:cytoskeletal protein CcmA (bactofilin family)